MTNRESLPVPLSPFGPTRESRFTLDRDLIVGLTEVLDARTRGLVAAYLRNGALVLALMEYTTDVIAGSFGVSGGSAVLTDGRFYWRRDAADYVEVYGVGLDRSAIDWMESNRWLVPPVEPGEIARIDDFLVEILSGSK